MVFSRQATKRFQTRVPAGTTRVLTEQIHDDATIEEIDVRFYAGPELTLQVKPYKEREGGDTVPLIDMVGDEYLVGDDDYYQFQISEQVERGDVLAVEFVNVSDEADEDGDGYDYQGTVDVTIDRAGGASRVLSSITGLIP